MTSDDLARQYAEALAAKFTQPVHRYDRKTDTETIVGEHPADRVDRTLTVTFIASDGYPASRVVTCMEAAEVCAAVTNDEAERLRRELETAQATIARVDALHQPHSVWLLQPCDRHQGPEWRRDIAKCPSCSRGKQTTCSNISCESWPCADHLALHDETEEECQHRG